MENNITVEKRLVSGSKACRDLREEGKVPAVIYSEGKEAEMITVHVKEFEKTWKEAGESTIVTLTGLDKDRSVIIQDVELEPLYGTPLHVDFYGVRTDREVTVEVPLVFDGVAPAEKELGGTLLKVLREIEVEALPKNLPKEIVVDISILKTFDDQILIKDIALPQGVKTTLEADEVVALVQEAREEEVIEVVDVSTIEVEKKGKAPTEETEA